MMKRRFKISFFTKIFKEIFTVENFIKFSETLNEKLGKYKTIEYYKNKEYKRIFSFFNDEYIDYNYNIEKILDCKHKIFYLNNYNIEIIYYLEFFRNVNVNIEDTYFYKEKDSISNTDICFHIFRLIDLSDGQLTAQGLQCNVSVLVFVLCYFNNINSLKVKIFGYIFME